VFRRLKESGVRIFLVTTDCREITGRCLDELKIRQYFDEIYTDDDDRGHPKPDPYLIQEIINKYGMKKEELVMVGDTVTDMEFAGNGGIKAIGVADQEADRRILKRYTEMVIDNIGYLPEIRKSESQEKGKST
ncbi:MAG TPA: HAD family hydrolase, partial [Candidatus Eisenbergiella merdipullorum]|nr:HAD family hydrolase [Candidatus Eisenbergiella merdipullorum]